MMEGKIQLQRWRRLGRRGTHPPTILPLHHSSHLSNTISCWYCDIKSSVFNEPLFHFGRKYSRCLRLWFSVGMGFSLTTLVGVTMIMLYESARALNLYNGIPWLNSILNSSILGSYYSVFKFSISVADVGYMCISSIISVSIHELGHALAAASEGIQIEYTAMFLAVVFPGALVAFNQELLQIIPRLASLRIYCAGIWHNAALCAVCALTLFLLPFILYPLYTHDGSLMVLDVSSKSPVCGYLSPGDLISKLDGKRLSTTNEWMEMADLFNNQIFQNNYGSRKGYCVPNSVIAESRMPEIRDTQTTCPNELTLFTIMSCSDLNTIDDHQRTQEQMFCLPAKGALGEKKCGDGWVNTAKNDTNCLCSEEASCLTPVQLPGSGWVEITYSKRYSSKCHHIGNRSLSRYNNSYSGETSCSGSFVFIGDIISMTNSVRLTEYQPRWFYGVLAYIPSVIEKMLVNTFQVSLMLALLNSLPVYYLDGESISEVAICCFSLLTPEIRKALLRWYFLAGTLISFLLIIRILLLVVS